VTAARVLVTGAAGFVGAAVAAELVRRGHRVTAAVRPGSDLHRLDAVAGAIDLHRADLRDPEAVERLVRESRPELCLHLAAAGAVVPCDDPDEVVAANALSPLELGRALERSGCGRLVTAGSSSEYGPVAGPMAEDRLPDPDDGYGAAKLAGMVLVRAAARGWDMRVAHLRLFSVYGPGEDPRRLVMSVLLALRAGVPIDLTPGGQVRDFVYLDDATRAFVAAGERDIPSGAVVNVGSGEEVSVHRLALTAAAVVGADPSLLRFGVRPYRSGERFAWRASTDLAAELLGWRAETPLRDGLVATNAWLGSGRGAERVA
jgi:nucleoside-diphosphate-sugar epimerase